MNFIAVFLITILSFLIPLALVFVLAAIQISGVCSEEEREEEEWVMRQMQNNGK